MRGKGKRVPSPRRSSRSRVVVLLALLAAALALPATASADEQELQKAKKSFNQAWNVVQFNYFPLSSQTHGLVEACNAIVAIDDPSARDTAIMLLDVRATEALERARLYRLNRAVLERRAAAILRAARDIDPAKIADVGRAHQNLRDAIGLLAEKAPANLATALGDIQVQNCDLASATASGSDNLVNRAAKLKVAAFKLL